ncbi:MAG TPA: LCP family protein [Streptomyces sp.]|nr:LCP family protein [Streptomyces sp.]
MKPEYRTWGPRPAARAPRSRRRRVLAALTWTLTGVVALGATGLGFVYLKLDGNIAGVDINGALGTHRPADTSNGSVDILVLGSDSRAGKNSEYGQDSGTARSDTAMIVHVNAGHDRAQIVSIPRDTLVARPPCRKDGQRVPPDPHAMFNSAYQAGGPVCAVKTVEKLTGVRMDHYVEVDFTGFKHLIDTLGGVPMTTHEPIHDQESHLRLKAGEHVLNGEQALALVRTRHGVGNGSDLGRIKLQHAFLSALIERVHGVGLFSDPRQLYDLADTATSALTTDSELDSIPELTGLAGTMKDLSADDVQMATMPVRYDPDNPNRVLPLEHKCRQVWKALRQDRPIPRSALRHTATSDTDIGDVVGTQE